MILAAEALRVRAGGGGRTRGWRACWRAWRAYWAHPRPGCWRGGGMRIASTPAAARCTAKSPTQCATPLSLRSQLRLPMRRAYSVTCSAQYKPAVCEIDTASVTCVRACVVVASGMQGYRCPCYRGVDLEANTPPPPPPRNHIFCLVPMRCCMTPLVPPRQPAGRGGPGAV